MFFLKHQHKSQVISQQISWSMKKESQALKISHPNIERILYRCNTVLLTPQKSGSGNIPRSPTFGRTHFPQAPDVLAAIDAMVSSAMIGAAANQEASRQKPWWNFPPWYQIPENTHQLGWWILFFMHFLFILGGFIMCHGEHLFFSLPLLMAIRMSQLPRRPGILIFWVGWWYPEETIGDANCPRCNRDPWSQIDKLALRMNHLFLKLYLIQRHGLFWSIPTDSSFRWAISSNKFSRTTWRNWDLRINDPGKYR